MDDSVARAFAGQNFDAIAAALERAGTAWGRLNDLPGLARHPALRRVSVTVPRRDLSIVAPAPIVDGQSPGLGPVPALGEHSAEIRAEFAPGAGDA